MLFDRNTTYFPLSKKNAWIRNLTQIIKMLLYQQLVFCFFDVRYKSKLHNLFILLLGHEWYDLWWLTTK